jgi:putative membrane protein
MQIVRTIFWIVVVALIAGFVGYNWGEKVPVKFWPLNDAPAVLDWPVGFIALFFFLLGFGPTWLLARATRWRLQRRINSLEKAIKDAVGTSAAGTPLQSEHYNEVQ